MHLSVVHTYSLSTYVLRIRTVNVLLAQVPIYALESFLGLRFSSVALYFDLLRECYEAFVIYSVSERIQCRE
jgi:hypothetical protein